MNTKAIYMPNGKAGEYAKYACNFYIGCSNNCAYCYCKKGVLGHAMGKPIATLKKCFKDEKHALKIFRTELNTYIEELRKHGIFFSFTTDPMLPETRELHFKAIDYALSDGVPCQVLTKCTEFIQYIPLTWMFHESIRENLAFGFTLTGCNELEPGASTNAERIEAMRMLHKMGFKTFASIEPVISIEKSKQMIEQTLGICNLYKIGLLSGHKDYTKHDVMDFIADVDYVILNHSYSFPDFKTHIKVYWKDSVLDYIGMNRDDLPKGICVNANYNIFQ